MEECGEEKNGSKCFGRYDRYLIKQEIASTLPYRYNFKKVCRYLDGRPFMLLDDTYRILFLTFD